MTKTHLIIPDQHAHYNYHNKRADWLAQLIKDIRPDVVVNIGDAADMPSLSGYEKGRASFHGRSYMKDIEAHLDFQERLWAPMKRSKKKLPYRVVFEGNHEYRIKRALDLQPELDGAISFDHLAFDKYYDDIYEYQGSTPAIACIDGIHYAHYFVSGVMGRPIGGEHPAYSLVTKRFGSATCGHVHTADLAFRTNLEGRKILGCVCGVFQDYDSDWAGEVNKLWWRGVVVKRNVDGRGSYDPQFISLDALRKEYNK